VSLDSTEAADALSTAAARAGVTVQVLAEIDVGLRRVGVTPGTELIKLLQHIDRLPGLAVAGLAFYPGHIKRVGAEADRELARIDETLCTAIGMAREQGFELRVVSGGSTPALFWSHKVRNMNEIRPGTYIFNDRNTWQCGACSFSDCAATVLTTVVSTSVPGRVIIDGGSKTFSSDRCSVEEAAGFGYIAESPDTLFERMNEEHGFLQAVSDHSWKVGDRIRVLPNHICTAMNLQEKVYGISGEEVVEVWQVKARGKLQ
jgi:D-serine deaminase-like pyridoxal phosphate-dependent protein